MTYPNTPGFTKGSATSEAAAQSVVESAPIMRERIEEFLKQRGTEGGTQYEVDTYIRSIGYNKSVYNCIASRLRDCELGGTAVRATTFDGFLTRPSPNSGRQQQVWLHSGKPYTAPVSNGKGFISKGGRDALLALDAAIIINNELQGGWWLHADGEWIRREIAKMLGMPMPEVGGKNTLTSATPHVAV